MRVRDIVVDADVMRSAGKTEHPVSRSSRQALETIRERGHRVVVCAPIHEEYRTHRSRFAKTWHASMTARKLVSNWDYKADADLRRRLSTAFPEDAENRRDAALKDAHLLEAAGATGKRIISRDVSARNLFRSACGELHEYGTVLWGELTSENDQVQEWLRIDLPDDRKLRLCPLT